MSDALTLDSHLTRTAKFTVTRASDEDGDGLTLEGYAAVFNDPTRIDSWEGKFDEIIAPGAFKRTIEQKGPKGIRLQFDHGAHPLIGSIPLGSIREIREDQRGLFMSARLAQNWLVEPVREAIANESIDGMSFRFRVIKDEWDESDPDLPVRTVKEVELLEAGPVVWPAYSNTSVGVRAREIAQELMDPERRAEIARALLSGTSEEPAESGTSEELATPDEPAATEPHFVNRSDEFDRTLASIDKHIPKESAA